MGTAVDVGASLPAAGGSGGDSQGPLSPCLDSCEDEPRPWSRDERSEPGAARRPRMSEAAVAVKVAYLGGWGRSGTTILGTLLGGYDGVFCAGEVHYIWKRGLVGRRLCGCGRRVTKCPLWREIRREAYGRTPPDPSHMVALQSRIGRLRHTPMLLSRRSTGNPEVAEYADIMARLYQAMATVTGARLIVDSSKYPSDAAILARLEGIDPYLVHMVRDPRAVAYSWRRRKTQLDRPGQPDMARHSVAGSSLSWLGINTALERVAHRYPDGHRLRVRYEQFAADPAGTVGQLLDWAAVEAGPGPFVDAHTAVLEANHTVSGNPGRFQTGQVRLEPDLEYRGAQPAADRRLVTALTLPGLLRYRYPVLRSSADSTPSSVGTRH